MWKHECSKCHQKGHSIHWCPLEACDSYNRFDGCSNPAEECPSPHICNNCGKDHPRSKCPDEVCLQFILSKCNYNRTCSKKHVKPE